MNYLMIINEKVEKFCSQKPPKGFEMEYLEKSAKLLNMYVTANSFAEEDDNPEIEEKLKKCLEEISQLIN